MGRTERLTSFVVPMGETLLARPRLVDWVGGAVLAVAAVAEVVLVDLPGPVPSAVLGLIGAAAFVVRRIRPLHTILVIGVLTVGADLTAWIADAAVEPTFASSLVGFSLIYTAGRWASARTVAVAAVFAFVLVPASANLNPWASPSVPLTIIDALVNAVVIAIGLWVRALADAREQRDVAAALRERNLLANDIHDSFAHHMSAIAIRAEAARQLDDPAELDDALRAIKRSASTGLADLRHFVTGLRAPDDDQRPLPGFGDIQQLAAELGTDAIDVAVDIDAEPELVPVSVSAAAYWITREALTNVCRHASGATRAAVTTRSTERYLDLTITDDGATSSRPVNGDGHGLSSMTARARSLGGDLTAGPNPTGGWLVAARLPLTRDEA